VPYAVGNVLLTILGPVIGGQLLAFGLPLGMLFGWLILSEHIAVSDLLGVVPVACTRFCELDGVPTIGGTKRPDVPAIIDLASDEALPREWRKVTAEGVVRNLTSRSPLWQGGQAL